jgi:hypothetical protein
MVPAVLSTQQWAVPKCCQLELDLSMAEPQPNYANADGMRTHDFPIDEEAVTRDRVSQWLPIDRVTLMPLIRADTVKQQPEIYILDLTWESALLNVNGEFAQMFKCQILTLTTRFCLMPPCLFTSARSQTSQPYPYQYQCTW